MTTPRSITMFKESMLVIERPRNREYHGLTWNTAQSHWYPVPIRGTSSLHASSQFGLWAVKLKISSPTSTSIRFYDFECDGRFLRITHEGRTRDIPILKKVGRGPLPTWITGHSHEVTTRSPDGYVQLGVTLWSTDGTQPPAPQQQQPQQQPQQPQQQRLTNKTVVLPSRVLRIFLEDAINKGESCPITMDDINLETARVTSCFHIFQGNAIQKWLETSSECPVCKQSCHLIAMDVSS
jgi:hypothetical protein